MLDDDDLAAWVAGLDDLFALVAGRFPRVEPRRRARAYVRGLLAPLASKNGWTLAEAAGDATPDGMQRLLNKAAWDADGVRDDVRSYVVRHLGSADGTRRPGTLRCSTVPGQASIRMFIRKGTGSSAEKANLFT
jgi:SRSO17 transposase